MESKVLKNVNRFGRIGNVIITILIVVSIIATIAVGVATVFVMTLPKDAVVVSVRENVEIRVNKDYFSKLWNALTDGFAYSSSEDPADIIGGDKEVLPPENQELQMKLKIFNNNFASAIITSEDAEKIIDAKTDASVYKSGNLVAVLVFGVLFLLSVIAALFMLKNLFKEIAKCETPFCNGIVNKMRNFSFSLIPVAVFASVGETLSRSFMTAGKDFDICIQWGIVLAFVVAICLVTVFKYGVQLQRESDETL